MSPVFTTFIRTFKLWTLIVFSFLSYSYNCLSPQLGLKLIEAGARVYCIKNFSALTHVIMSWRGWGTDNISEYLLPRIERFSDAYTRTKKRKLEFSLHIPFHCTLSCWFVLQHLLFLQILLLHQPVTRERAQQIWTRMTKPPLVLSQITHKHSTLGSVCFSLALFLLGNQLLAA